MLSKYIILLWLVSFQFSSAQTLSIGQFSIGHSPVKIDFNDFQIQNSNSDIRAQFLEETLQWIRSDKNLLTPRVLLKIEISNKHFPIYIKYQDQLIVPIKQEQFSKSQLYVNLFSPSKLEIYESDKKIDEIFITTKPFNQNSQKQWIDYSCLPYQVQLNGIENEYVSLGCRLDLIGEFGKEKPRLEVTMSSTNLKSPLGSSPPFTFYFDESAEIQTRFINLENIKKNNEISLKAKLPERVSRLKLAAGLGPYSYANSYLNQSKGPVTNFSYMLYGKLGLTESSSLKAFDALIYDKTFFNNSGLYYAFDLARLLDGRIIVGTLLGFQGLHYKYDEGYNTDFEFIYPQGFELTYLHPFGFQNYYASYGMFVSTTKETYKNIWIRYGRNVFYEINYIKWGKESSSIEMWGLSLGFPIGQFF